MSHPSLPESPSHDVVATLRHDLRTPLNQIIGYSELLQEEAADLRQESMGRDLDRILAASRQLLGMIDQVIVPGQIQLLRDLPDLRSTAAAKPVNPTLFSSLDLDVLRPKVDEAEKIVPPTPVHLAATVLVVDDDAANCDLLARRLVQEGYEVLQAYGGKQALESLHANPDIDIVLLDVLMPDLGGFEVLVIIKNDEHLRHIPVIMISALDQLESVVRCIQNGADDYLGKPFNLTFLRARLGASLDRKRLRDQEQRIYHALQKTQEALVVEQEKSESLLLNMLPKSIANLLRDGSGTIAEHHLEATILFADLADFTTLAEGIPAMEVVELLNSVFMSFDEMAEQYGVEKIKTIGDCYMVAAGVPVPCPNHAVVLTRMALEMQRSLSETTFHGRHLRFRMGMNTGPVVAGVIGRKKFIYDLWGDAVNTASRMETHGTIGAIQITRSTYELIRDDFICEARGRLPIKGKGEMEVWHVIAPRTKENPTS